MPLKKGTIRSYTRKSASGKAVQVTSYSRDEHVTGNQLSGEKDTFHNAIVANAGKSNTDTKTEHDPEKFARLCPLLYSELQQAKMAVTRELSGIVKQEHSKIQKIIREVLKNFNGKNQGFAA